MCRANSLRRQPGVWKGLLVQSTPPLIVTSNPRTIRCMKSELSDRASGALPGHHPGPIEVSPSLCKAELQKILDSFDVRDCYLEVRRVLNHLRGASGQRK